MDKIEIDDDKVLISQNVDTSNPFFDGLGLRELIYMLWTVPLYPLIMYFPIFPNATYWVSLIVRISICIMFLVIFYGLVKMHSLRGAKISDLDILIEKIKFSIRKKQGKTTLFYNKFRKG